MNSPEDITVQMNFQGRRNIKIAVTVVEFSLKERGIDAVLVIFHYKSIKRKLF